MRHQVTVVLPSTAQDSFGQPVAQALPSPGSNWLAPSPAQPPMTAPADPNVLGPFWAFVQPLKGDESFVAANLRGLVSHQVTMRWIGSIVSLTPRHFLIFQGRTLNIKQVLNVNEINRTYNLLCSEVVT